MGEFSFAMYWAKFPQTCKDTAYLHAGCMVEVQLWVVHPCTLKHSVNFKPSVGMDNVHMTPDVIQSKPCDTFTLHALRYDILKVLSITMQCKFIAAHVSAVALAQTLKISSMQVFWRALPRCQVVLRSQHGHLHSHLKTTPCLQLQRQTQLSTCTLWQR